MGYSIFVSDYFVFNFFLPIHLAENFTFFIIPDPSGFRGVAAPVTKPRPEGQPSGPPLSTCGQCGRLITYAFKSCYTQI